MPCWTVLPEEEGLRLDHVLQRLLPDIGLRGRRRACASGLVTVNGSPVREAFKVRAGDLVETMPARSLSPADEPGGSTAPYEDAAHVLQIRPPLAFLYKPAGLHSVSLAGRPCPSLERLLPRLLGVPKALLLNRLDCPTSGIAAAALDNRGEALYHEAENAGRLEKRYLALLEGELPETLLADMPLDCSGGKHVRVLSARGAAPLRQTLITPLALLDGSALKPLTALLPILKKGRPPAAVTLAGCVIAKGARHQIRAHCAALGFPLLGDRRYGSCLQPEDGERFFLHHALLCLPGLRIQAPVPWLAALEAAAPGLSLRITDWLALPAGTHA